MVIKSITTEKGFIEYSQYGDGIPLLFVHGSHGSCRDVFYKNGLDAEQFNFITPSRPGYGDTPLTNTNKSVQGTAELIIALLDKLQVDKVIVVGISSGGPVAIALAALSPERVIKLVLMSAVIKKWFSKKNSIYRRGIVLFNPLVEKFTWFSYRLFYNLFPKFSAGIMFRELSFYRPVKFTDEECMELKEMSALMDSGRGFYNDIRQKIDPDISKNIACPALIIHSKYDNLVDESHPENAKAKIQNSKLVLVSNHWGHLLWVGKEYESVLKELKKFLES